MAVFRLVAAYHVRPTKASITAAAKYHGFNWMLDESGELRHDVPTRNLNAVALVEFEVFGGYSPSEVASISYGEQRPYLEFYLDPTGTRDLEEREAVQMDGRRLCFFIHAVDPSLSLRVAKRQIDLPPLTELPARLVPFTHYAPAG